MKRICMRSLFLYVCLSAAWSQQNPASPIRAFDTAQGSPRTFDQTGPQAEQSSVYIGGQHHRNPLKPHSFFVWPYLLQQYLTTSSVGFILRSSVDTSGPAGTAHYNYYDVGLYCLQGECANPANPLCNKPAGCAGMRCVHSGIWPYTRVDGIPGTTVTIPWMTGAPLTLPPGLYAIAIQNASWGTTTDSAHVAGDATGNPSAGPVQLFLDWWGQDTQPAWPDYKEIFTDPPRVTIAAFGGDSSNVTIQVDQGVLTVTLNQGTFSNFGSGDYVQFEGLANATFLNDQPPLRIQSATSTSFTAVVGYAPYPPTCETTQGAITNVTESKGGLPPHLSLKWANPCQSLPGYTNNFFCYGPGAAGAAGSFRMIPPHAANFFFN